MNCAQAKRRIDLVEYLASLGYLPAYIRRESDYWYLSPLRDEKNSSFHVNRDKNIWKDFGGSGGTIIDFAMEYYRCDIKHALIKLEEYLQLYRPVDFAVQKTVAKGQLLQKEKKIIILSAGPIQSSALFYYSAYRKIPIELVQIFCCEVKYTLYNKIYYAIGFKNDLGGYEIRNRGFKGSSMPKGITFINRGFDTVEVFEGFFSFLSFLIVIKDWEQLRSNFLILNSLSFFNKSRELMEKHQFINLHLDRDNSGFLKMREVLNNSKKYRDASIAYFGFKDWNKYLKKEPNLRIMKIKSRVMKRNFCSKNLLNGLPHGPFIHNLQMAGRRLHREIKYFYYLTNNP